MVRFGKQDLRTNKNQKPIKEKHKAQKQRNDVVLHSCKGKGRKRRRASTTPELEREKTDKMRFSVDLQKAEADPGRSPTPKRDEVEWVPLQNHPVFFPATGPVRDPTAARPLRNLLAWDGASRLYFWDSDKLCLHRISIRLGEPDPTSVLAASPSKVLQADVNPDFAVQKISINRNGSALLLSGSGGLCVMYLYYGRTSNKDNATICRTVTVGSQIYLSGSNIIRILQVSWHPNSDTHLGILSSDSVFRIFDLSSDLIQPEQEYYLQPVQPGRSRNATSICPVDFSFGSDHLWDLFSVFILFNDGSVYILCPIIPFGSAYKWESIVEIYNDAQTFGLKSSNSVAVSNSNLAISWLEATFPAIADQETEGSDLYVLRAHPYALFDASLSLQGPLRKVCRDEDEEGSAFRGAECEGGAVSFLYNLVVKDSIMVTAWSGGQLQIDALADEIQPVWNVGSPPRLRVDSNDHIRGLAMICEPTPGKVSPVKLNQPLDSTLWLGHPPPLLRLAIVDLALPRKTKGGSLIMMFIDPLMPERIFTLHDGGIDSIVLHYLPFTNQISGKTETMRTPSVHPVLSTCQGEISSQAPLSGFVSLSDSFGCSWIVGVTGSRECIMLEMKTWNLLLPLQVDMEGKSLHLEEPKEKDMPDMISKELLVGPKVVLVPQTSPNVRSVSADSIEGRSMLHDYFKLFHENYVEYAHKVHFELKHHEPLLKKIINDQHARLGDAQQKLLQVEEKQSKLENRIDSAIQLHNVLEERLKRLRKLPGPHKKPLSRAEREFKSELDLFSGVELDALHSSVNALTARLRRHAESPKGNTSNQQRLISRRKDPVEESQVSQLKSSLEKLSLVNSVNSKKVKLVESALRSRESSRS
ncbi:PREDICTED: nuclear pore complex protein NUP88 [Prunus mume]|uniref:Nuclear pore complex protein NUP88 n=1 Tax=Prunus mume TaxID=102107 RepID=A0ABM0P377_PRUMU|nr:PREDICTED: nuclear pore complex protein NUP88 [Prunus mume]